MILQYNELATDLDRIRRFLRNGAEERQTSDQRRFGYIACISALYSSFENFIERVVFRFSEMTLENPETLSETQMTSLRRRYVRNASALLGQNLGAGRYREVTELDVARSLASCLDDSSSSFDLRLELISLHNYNLRWESLAELFQWAVPDLLGRIQSSDAVKTWMSNTDNVTERTLASVLKNELDDLVERRNEVAHRAIPDEILSHENMLAKVNYVEAVALGLVASLSGLLLDSTINRGDGISLGVPEERLKDGRVVIFSSLAAPVSVGDIIVCSARSTMRWGRVQEIQVADTPVERAEAGVEAGINLDFSVRKKAELHIWPAPESELASPPDGIFGSWGPSAKD